MWPGSSSDSELGLISLWESLSQAFVTEPHLVNSICCREGECSVYCRPQARSPGQLVLKRPKFPKGFQRKVYRDRVGEGGCGVWDQLVDILLIGWCWGNQGSTSSTFWFQPVWSLCACGQPLVNFFHLVRVSLCKIAQDIIYSPWGRTKGPWLCLMAKVSLFCLAWLFSLFSSLSRFTD